MAIDPGSPVYVPPLATGAQPCVCKLCLHSSVMLAKLQPVHYSLIVAQGGFGSSLPLLSGLHLTSGRKHE